MNKLKENDRINKLFQAFQAFQMLLTLKEVSELRRHIIAIEKALFWKGGAK